MIISIIINVYFLCLDVGNPLLSQKQSPNFKAPAATQTVFEVVGHESSAGFILC